MKFNIWVICKQLMANAIDTASHSRFLGSRNDKNDNIKTPRSKLNSILMNWIIQFLSLKRQPIFIDTISY